VIGIKFSFNDIKGLLALPEDFSAFIKNFITLVRWTLSTKGVKGGMFNHTVFLHT
jgi:hypothetical protein